MTFAAEPNAECSVNQKTYHSRVIDQSHYLRYSPIAHLRLLVLKAIIGFSFGLAFLNLNQKLPHLMHFS